MTKYQVMYQFSTEKYELEEGLSLSQAVSELNSLLEYNNGKMALLALDNGEIVREQIVQNKEEIEDFMYMNYTGINGY
jgi:hypothetical protein